MPRKIPILDIAKYHKHRAAFVEELRVACHTVGFFLIQHDFGGLAEQMLEETKSFFARPLEEKLKISYEDSPSFRGYMKLGVENTSGKVDCREQVEYAVEYDSGSNVPWPVYERLKAENNPWPTDFQPNLEAVTKEYSSKVCHVADILRDSLCLALELDPKEAIHDKFVDPMSREVPHWVIKLVSYPPLPAIGDCREEHVCREQQGVGAHTDTNFLTLVLQDSIGTGGLQAYSMGEWIDVEVPSSKDAHENDSASYLICNLGEQAETWSRGYFLATPHRVITKESPKQLPRTSVPLFYNPLLSATMGPLDKENLEGIPWERHKEYSPWRRPNNLMNPSVGENTFKSLARSHPSVFEKHHPDLELLQDGRILRR